MWCCSLWQGKGGLHSWLAAREGCALGQVLLCPRRRGGGQPHGVNRCRSQSVRQTKGPFLQSLTKTVHKCLESTRRKRAGAEWPSWCPLPAVGVQLRRASLSWAALVSSSGWIWRGLPWSCVSPLHFDSGASCGNALTMLVWNGVSFGLCEG